MPTLELSQKEWEDLKEEFAQLCYPYTEEKLVKELESHIVKDDERKYILLYKRARISPMWYPLNSYITLEDAIIAYNEVLAYDGNFIQYKIVLNIQHTIKE